MKTKVLVIILALLVAIIEFYSVAELEDRNHVYFEFFSKHIHIHQNDKGCAHEHKKHFELS